MMRFQGRSMWRALAWMLATWTLAAAGACSRTPPAPRARPVIVCTVGMVSDIVRQVVGDRAEVVGIIGEGVDPHLFTPTVADVRRFMEADLVFYCGLMLEGRMEDALETVRDQGKRAYAVTEGLDQDALRAPPAFEGHYDPHVWMDVARWSRCTRQVARRMAEFDPEHAAVYEENADRFCRQLEELNSYVAEVIATIPESQRVLVTAHDAFGYFSDAYGIPVASAQGITTESEPGVNDINQLVDFLVERRIPAIFVETSVSARNVQALIEGAASQGHQVIIGGELYSDAMGPAGSYEGTYVGMIDHNATTIARALGGEAPPRGMQGRLAVD